MNAISTESQSELDKRCRTTTIIYFSFLFTAAILTIAGWFSVAPASHSADPNSLTPLWLAIIFIAAGTFVLRRVLTNWERLREAKLLKGDAGLFAKLQTNSIILGSMAEVIAVIGFVIAQSTGVKADMLRAGFVSLIVFLINFPRKSVWRKIAANLEKV